jgi:hypothetical protein
MPFEPSPSSRKPNSAAADSLDAGDLHGACFAVGGGDPYIAELVQEARRAGYEVSEPLTTRLSAEGSTFCPPGFEPRE